MPDIERIMVKICRCGLVWCGGNEKYCPAGHAYEFEERAYVPEPERPISGVTET